MMSRPWKVFDTRGSQNRGSSRLTILDGRLRRGQATQQSVVRRDELLRADAGIDDPPLGPDARVDHRDVDRSGRKKGRRLRQNDRPATDVLSAARCAKMSTIRAAGLIDRMTPFIAAT